MVGVGIGLGGGGGGGAPTVKTAQVGASTTGPVYTIARLLGSTSTLALVAGTNSNLTLSGTTIVAAAALGGGISQTAVVRESSGAVAIEYPVTLTGYAAGGTLGPSTASFTAGGAGSTGAVPITGLATGETIASVDNGATASGTSIAVPKASAGVTAYSYTTSAGRQSSVTVTVSVVTNRILLESGDALLREDGSYLLLEAA